MKQVANEITGSEEMRGFLWSWLKNSVSLLHENPDSSAIPKGGYVMDSVFWKLDTKILLFVVGNRSLFYPVLINVSDNTDVYSSLETNDRFPALLVACVQLALRVCQAADFHSSLVARLVRTYKLWILTIYLYIAFVI